MNDTNKIIFRRSDYKTQEEFFDIVFRQMRILIENDSVFSFHENPNVKGLYALQFGPSQVNDSNTYPVWLNGEEILYVTKFMRDNEYQKAKITVEEYENDDSGFWDDEPIGDKKPDA